MFVHINLLHLLMNMFSLLIVGPYVEKLYGSAKFVVFWVVTGIAGWWRVTSRATHLPRVSRNFHLQSDRRTIGGCFRCIVWIGRRSVSSSASSFVTSFRKASSACLAPGMLPIIFINLFIGFIGRGFIGNARILAGFSGAALALFVDYRRPGEHAVLRPCGASCRSCAGDSFGSCYKVSSETSIGPQPARRVRRRSVVDFSELCDCDEPRFRRKWPQ